MNVNGVLAKNVAFISCQYSVESGGCFPGPQAFLRRTLRISFQKTLVHCQVR
jgi:hypothetical protein